MHQLFLYRDMDQADLVCSLLSLTESCGRDRRLSEEQLSGFDACVSRLVETGETYGLNGHLVHCCIALFLANSDNVFSRACEKAVPEGSIVQLARLDFARIRTLFSFDWSRMDELAGLPVSGVLTGFRSANRNRHLFNARVRDRICRLGAELAAAEDDTAFFDAATSFYREYGVGDLGLHKAFRIETDDRGIPELKPITCTEHVRMDQLVGYEAQKERLLENTRNFVLGRAANNCLLYGDAGTGKSSCIKAVMNEFYGDGLRLIEVYRHQFRCLPAIISRIKGRNYRFILYMDDLSFEDFETDYKYLKAVIEGGLENRPENVLIYATSNRRHLVRESFDDRKDYSPELHSSDTVQEKLSLAARFGVSIYFGAPDKAQYEEIVKALAEREGIRMEEDRLLKEASRWELRHGGRSGRCAAQFIIWLKGRLAGDAGNGSALPDD